jgi:phage terminase large subunit-like protein
MATRPRKYKNHPHVGAAKQYARDVVRQKIAACRWTQIACQRFLDDLRRKASEFEWTFNEDRAERACRFVELLPHVKGKWSGSNIVLEPWQCFIYCNIFGWEHRKTHLRRFRRAFVFVPRKNGKTTMAAPIGLLMLTVEAEPGAEVYCGATSEDQANEVFRPAKAMTERAEDFKSTFGVDTMKSSIFREEGLSFFRKLIGKPGEGQSPYCAIHDEYHEHTTSEQVDSMDTGMGARQEPLQLIITTAGTDVSGPCKEFDDFSRKVLEGSLQDERLFALHYTVDDGDDWEDFEVWRKANPNLGVSVSEEYLRGKLNEAKQRVSQQNTVRTKHLNQWMNAGSAWMNMSIWRRCEDHRLRLQDFKGVPCWAGIDLASKIDITARILLFRLDELWYAFGRYYLPEETIQLPENDHYRRWLTEGWIIETDGARTDFHRVEEDLKEDCEFYPVKELAFDPREASYLVQNIQEWAPFECVEIPQGPAHMSEPMKELEAVIYDNKLRTNGDPVLTWMMSNVVKKQSKTGAVKYYYPSKERDSQKIDGVVALIMALGRAMTYEDQASVYETRGLLTI